MPREAQDLGDGVSVEIVEGLVVLTTDEGSVVTNRIVLEFETLVHLSQYLARCGFHLGLTLTEAGE